MRWFDFIAITLLFLILILGLYLLWINLPQEPVQYEEYRAAIEQDLPLQSSQFYPNMRYPDKEISFYLSDSCSQKKKSDFREAVKILEESTILNFVEATQDNAQIKITCSNISPEPQQEDHFIAGEGGPSLFLNTTKYAIIVSGEVALYRPDTCEIPQIALHELLHALGFDHNSDENSIMYPVTNCGQELDNYIISEINRIYSEPSLSDLAIESVQANKSGRYLNFDATISNLGLKTMKSSVLEIIVNNELVKEFEIGEIDLGAKRHLVVTNLRLPRDSEKITLSIKTTQVEITKENNEIEIKPSD